MMNMAHDQGKGKLTYSFRCSWQAYISICPSYVCIPIIYLYTPIHPYYSKSIHPLTCMPSYVYVPYICTPYYIYMPHTSVHSPICLYAPICLYIPHMSIHPHTSVHSPIYLYAPICLYMPCLSMHLHMSVCPHMSVHPSYICMSYNCRPVI